MLDARQPVAKRCGAPPAVQYTVWFAEASAVGASAARASAVGASADGVWASRAPPWIQASVPSAASVHDVSGCAPARTVVAAVSVFMS